MDQYIIKGGNPLVGEVEIGGAKNAALAILAAAIMTDDTVRLENLPDVNDINVLLEAICWVHFSENIKKPKYLCRVAVTSEAARLTCI